MYSPSSILAAAPGISSSRAVKPYLMPRWLGSTGRQGCCDRLGPSRRTSAGCRPTPRRFLFRRGALISSAASFAFHHFQAKTRMLRDTFRVLRPGGCFVLRNLCPQESLDWLYYEYFPEAQVADLCDFWPPEAMIAVMEGIGFTSVTMEQEHLHFEQDLSTWIKVVQRRDTCSQLLAISDAAYKAGLRRLARELEEGTAPRQRADHLCLLTIRGEKPSLCSA